MTTTSTPGGYTSRFVAHVAHGQTTAHDEATSNSSNPLDRNRFRAFSADGTDERCSAGRVDDAKVIAATATVADSAYDIDADGDALKPQATNTSSAQTDVITDKSTTSSTSSYLAISEPESLLGNSRGDSRVMNVTFEDDDALVQDRSGNGKSRSQDESTLTIEDDSDTRRNATEEMISENHDFEDAPSFFRIIVEDVDASVAEKSMLDSTNQSRCEIIDEIERRDRSRSKESHSISECSSSVSGRTMSYSESESDSENVSEEENEEEESRDENCNVKNKKKENKKDDRNYDDNDNAESETNEENKESSNSDSDEETTVLSISSNIQGESSATPDDRYERDLKRRSASIIDERSIEEMFDDNGWVVTEQDLEQDLPNDLRTVSTILLDFPTVDRPSEQIASSIGDVNDAAGTRTDEIIPKIAEERHNETSSNFEDSSTQSSITINAEMVPSSEWQGFEAPSRSRVYRQSSLGKNGWLVSDESESESDRTTSPIEASSDRDVTRTEFVNEAIGFEGIEDTGDIDENGWIILDDDDDDDDDDDNDNDKLDEELTGASSAQNTICSQTIDFVDSKTNIENGALVADVKRSKGTEQSGPDKHEETPGASMSVPMQMVTTVFCMSVLCYSILTNLFP